MRKRLGKTTNKKLIRKLFDSALEKSVDVSGIEEWDINIELPEGLAARNKKIKAIFKAQSSFQVKERK